MVKALAWSIRAAAWASAGSIRVSAGGAVQALALSFSAAIAPPSGITTASPIMARRRQQGGSLNGKFDRLRQLAADAVIDPGGEARPLIGGDLVEIEHVLLAP